MKQPFSTPDHMDSRSSRGLDVRVLIVSATPASIGVLDLFEDRGVAGKEGRDKSSRFRDFLIQYIDFSVSIMGQLSFSPHDTISDIVLVFTIHT